MGLFKEGIQQAKEALEIYERLDETTKQAGCLISFALLLLDDKQLDAAEEAASRAIGLLSEEDEPFQVCESHLILGKIYQSKGDAKEAIHHFEAALGIASSFNWHDRLFWSHLSLGWLFCEEGRFDNAHAHVEHAKSHAIDNTYNLTLAMELQAVVWYRERRLAEARSEALRAADVYEKLGAAEAMEACRKLAQRIQGELDNPVASGQTALNRELL